MYFKFIFTSFFLIQVIYSQYQNVLITNLYSPNEVSIAINPKNTNQVVAGSNISFAGQDTSFSGYYYSINGGLNWTIGHISSTLAMPSGDPVIIVDTAGNFYYLMNSSDKAPPRHGSLLSVKSSNGGASWTNGSFISYDTATFQDKPWGCVDFSGSVYGNNIYVTWTRFSHYGFNAGPQDSSIILFSKSTNGAETWSSPFRLSRLKGNAADSSDTMEGAVPCTGPSGEIYVAWAGPRTLHQQYGIFFDRSTDGGNTWLDEDIYVTDQPGGWYIHIPNTARCNGFPVTCCDLSTGPNRGTIYINWSDKRSGANDNDVWLVKSTNGGLNWSQAKRVNNDPPGKNQFFNWMTIDQATGYLYFIFYDQRNTTTLYADVYAARSTDGGETFDNVKVNTNAVNNLYMSWDYIGIAAHNNKVRPIWTGYNQHIFTAIIDSFYSIGINHIGSEIPREFKLYQNYPNPFNPSTKIQFALPPSPKGEGLGVRVIIYDILGREVSTLVNEQLQPGTYEVEWNAGNFSSGVYYYRLISGETTETKKMVLLK